MSLFSIHLEPKNLGEELKGAVRPKNLIEFLKSIPQERISNAALVVDQNGVILKSESPQLAFFNEAILVGELGFTPHHHLSSVLELFMDSTSIEVKSEDYYGSNTRTIATLMIVLGD